jgi:sigma54-dependent transcription regulator
VSSTETFEGAARSERAQGAFVVVNCPTLTGELLASELFGHARGAFTGAVKDQPGRVEAAEGGTLFLDEIAEIPPALQAKLLRFLQDREFERLGETRTRRADVRLVAATNRDLAAEVAAARFREDLLYRLNVVEIVVPPLRERKEDVLPLARRFATFFAASARKPAPDLSPETERVLLDYSSAPSSPSSAASGAACLLPASAPPWRAGRARGSRSDRRRAYGVVPGRGCDPSSSPAIPEGPSTRSCVPGAGSAGGHGR